MLNFQQNPQQLLQAAMQHHQAGRFPQAEALYKQVLQMEPRHADALNLLGVLAHQTGHNDVAEKLIKDSIAVHANNAAAHSNLALAQMALNKFDDAVAACRRAIELKPDYAEAFYNLGLALKGQKKIPEAIEAAKRAIALRPQWPEALNALGNALKECGRADDAMDAFRKAISQRPAYAEALSNLGNVLLEKHRNQEAIAAYRQAVQVRPDFAGGYFNLGTALRDLGQVDEAIAALRRSVALAPDQSRAHNNLGNALRDAGRTAEAIASFRQAILIEPELAMAHANLAAALQTTGQLDEAERCGLRAIALAPDAAESHNALGNIYKDQGRLDEALAEYRKATELDPADAGIHNNLVFTMQYHPGYDTSALAAGQREWSARHTEPLRSLIRPHDNDRDPGRRLRVGYVSPDLRNHPVGRFLLPLLERHDRKQFEIFCYAQVPAPDAMSAEIRGRADHWKSIVGVDDEGAAEMIRGDDIDILVDLAGPTAHNRLLVFARKPAPVQVTWLGYPGSTGMSAIDYRISDQYLDPADSDFSLYAERTVRLPGCFWCYRPVAESKIAVAPPPARANGYATFGCLTNFCKINPHVLELWSRVLAAAPGSRLLMHAHEGSHRRHAREFLAARGVDPARIEFAGILPLADYFRAYQNIDVALDPFPYGGGTTTCDALWMGVPVVSLAGTRPAGRAGLTILSNAGLPDLAAATDEEYVHTACDLARDIPRLENMRNNLRPMLEHSKLMDAASFARDIEVAYRMMWREWVEH